MSESLENEVERKYVGTFDASEWQIDTDEGFVDLKSVSKTVPYEIWQLRTETKELKCADNHIVFTSDLREVYVKDLSIGDKLFTDTGFEEVVSVENTKEIDNMYDLDLDNTNKRFFTNGILSHNSTIIGLYALWLAMFSSKKKPVEIWVLSNKAASAQSFLDDIKKTYEELEPYLKAGMAEYNKTSITFDNGSSINTGATSKDAIRGESPTFLILDEFAHVAPHKAEEFFTAILPTIACVAGDSLILTENGYSKIEQFSPNNSKIGDYIEIENLNVYGENGIEKASHFYNSPKSETRNMSTEYGFMLESTLDHPVKVLNENGFGMVKTQDVKVGDQVSVFEGMNVYGKNECITVEYELSKNQFKKEMFKKEVFLDDDLSYMIGGYLAEGWMVKNGTRSLYISNTEEDFREVYIRNGFKEINKGRIYANAKIFEIFKKILGDVWDKKCHEKEIPNFILGATERIQKQVLSGYIDGDGCVLKDGSIVMVSTSRKMLSQIQIMLINMGIVSRINENRINRSVIGERIMPQGKKLQSLMKSFSLVIPRSYSPTIKKEFQLKISRKKERLLDSLKSERDSEKQKKITLTDWMMDTINEIFKDKVITKSRLRKEFKVRTERWKKGQTIKMETFSRYVNCLKEILNEQEKNKYNFKTFLELNKKCLYVEIRNIEKSFNRTYDLTCPETHTFLQNGILGSNTGGSMCIISTPNGNSGRFYDIFKEAKFGEKEGDGEGDFWHFEMEWNEPPGRTEAFKRSQIKASSIQEWNQEYEAKFLGSSSTLISGEKLEAMDDETEEPYKNFDDIYKIWEKPVKNRCYIVACDVSKGVEKDNSVIQVIDVTNDERAKQVAIWADNKLDPYDFTDKVYEIAKYYNEAYVIIENNTYGHEVCRRLWTEFEYMNMYKERKAKTFGVNANRKNKSIGTSLLKRVVESDRLNIKDEETYKELCGFIEVNPDIYKCDNGRNSKDDRVMALVWFAFLFSSEFWDNWKEYYKKEAAGEGFFEEEKNEKEEYIPLDFGNIYEEEDIMDDGWLQG
jgi:hypothetical protein